MHSRVINQRSATLAVVLIFGLSLPIGAGVAIGLSWSKDEVMPVVLVKPAIGGFSPVEGISIGNHWVKDEVRPVVLVKPGVAGFIPHTGSSIGNHWDTGDVIPVMLVEPTADRFIPLKLLDNSGSPVQPGDPIAEGNSDAIQHPATVSTLREQLNARQAQAQAELEKAEGELATVVAKLAPAGDGPTLIESHISGTFKGWDGETIFKLDNGQIWQQATYAYTYHYAYHPEVMIIKTHGAYKMKVDGVSGMIFVKRLR